MSAGGGPSKPTKKVNKTVFSVGDRVLLVSPSGGGKTNVIRNMILKRGFLPAIERVEVVTASPDDYEAIAGKLNGAADNDVVIIQTPDDIDGGDLSEFEGHSLPSFVILDDILGHPRVGRLLEQITTHGRHANSIFAISTQAAKDVSTTVRQNSNFVCIFPGLMTPNEQRNAWSMVPGDLSREDFAAKLDKVRAAGPFGFLTIRRGATGPDRYWLNFSGPI